VDRNRSTACRRSAGARSAHCIDQHRHTAAIAAGLASIRTGATRPGSSARSCQSSMRSHSKRSGRPRGCRSRPARERGSRELKNPVDSGFFESRQNASPTVHFATCACKNRYTSKTLYGVTLFVFLLRCMLIVTATVDVGTRWYARWPMLPLQHCSALRCAE
jgi:hypothetical protein